MKTMIAVKPMRYGTRRLVPCDSFDVKDNHARLLVAVKKAVERRDVAQVAPPPAVVRQAFAQFDPDRNGTPGGSKAPEKTEELVAARAAYTEKLGKRPFPGWDIGELHRRIAEASEADA